MEVDGEAGLAIKKAVARTLPNFSLKLDEVCAALSPSRAASLASRPGIELLQPVTLEQRS